jgi:3',5'-cyclic AMP phosphodiesterase CpdA
MTLDTNATLEGDGVDRRGFLRCMAWAGAGALWTMSAGLPGSRLLGAAPPAAEATDFTFVQISDSHIGFSKEPYKDVSATLKLAVDKINALPKPPAFVLHTGDLTHLAKPEEFDNVAEILKGIKTEKVFYVPGEHDVFTDDGKLYLQRFGKGTQGLGYHSFDMKGVHFVGLVNVANLKPGGMGMLGKDQLDWLKKDLAGLKDSTPVVVFAHVPLWTLSEKWGWGTADSEQALELMKRFPSVTVLNGHVHQVMQKVEGKVTFHTACSTAFPQPEPGKADSPGPRKDVPAEKVRSLLGLSTVNYVEKKGMLAVTDGTLD